MNGHEEIIQRIQQSPNGMVKVGITDVDGILRTKYLDRNKVVSALSGSFGFCNVLFGWDGQDALYPGAGADPSYADLPATIDPSTARNIPWEEGILFLLADFSGTGATLSYACPRSLLKRVIARAGEMGFTTRFGPEYEWFTYRETPESVAEKGHKNLRPLSPGMFGYSGLRTGQFAEYHRDLFRQLAEFGIPLEGLHTETGPGVLEAALLHQPALEAADRAVLFKEGVKQISYRHGLLASFMAKPNADLPGCGGHLHQSLWRGEDNAFFDPAKENGMSDVFRHYLAGQLRFLPALQALYAPTVNSYKRYVPGSWAATRACWGVDNRTVALRAIPGGKKGTRLETRLPGADANPYLVIAAALASGLYGVRHELELPPPTVGSAYEQAVGAPLAKDLGAAAGAMASGAELGELLGDEFLQHYHMTRQAEWAHYQRAVTDWERGRYFEII